MVECHQHPVMEGNALFNDAHNTFHIPVRLYGVGSCNEMFGGGGGGG